MSGMPRESLLGKTIAATFPVIRDSGVLDLYLRVHETGERYDGEYQPQDPRVSAAWVRLQVVNSGDGVAITSRDITSQKRAEEALRALSLNDELTGLLNRRGLTQFLERELLVARRQQRSNALLFIDLDDFKLINDRFGHAEGDVALRTVARLLQDAIRASDVVGRYGGDEFVVYALGSAQSKAPGTLVERIHAAVANDNALHAEARGYSIALSIGTSEVAFSTSLDEALRDADASLYAAKRERPGRRNTPTLALYPPSRDKHDRPNRVRARG